MLMDKFHNRYIVKGTIIAETPIHIGVGSKSIDLVDTDNAVIKDKDGKPYIPGSSFKGALRSWLETFLRGRGSKTIGAGEDNICLCVNEPCIGDDNESRNWLRGLKKKYEGENNADRLIAKEIYERLCAVCRVFGSQRFASKITIHDSKLKGEKAYIEKRDGVAIDRDTGTAATNKKYDFEQVASGAEFDFYMTADNLDKDNVEILKLIINVLKNGDLIVGGKTSVGLGRVRLYDPQVYKIDTNNLENYLLNGLSEEMRWKHV